MSDIVETNDTCIKRGRGRPKKDPKTDTGEIIEKRPRGRPCIENPVKSGCPKGGKLYFNAYYRSHNVGNIINCPNCNALTEKFNLRNHIKSKMCAKYSQFTKCASVEV